MTDRNPLDILKERYVNGEITKEQFNQMKDALEAVYKSKENETTENQKEHEGLFSSSWVFAPFLFGLLGGIIAYLMVKEDNRKIANQYLAIGIIMTIFLFIIFWYIGMTGLHQAGISQSDLQQAIKQKLASQQQPTVPQNTPQTPVNTNPLSLSLSYMNDFGKYTSNECGTSASPTCIAIINTLQQDCSNPALLQVESASCDLFNSTLNMRQSYLNSLSPTIGQNWAGYIAESDLYNPQPVVGQVSASWQVVPIPTSNLDQMMAQWIGIGGYANIGGSTDESLIQVGTSSENVCQLNQQCTLNYTAWYEIYPHNYETPLMSVNAGDTVTAAIDCESGSVGIFKQDTCKGKTQEWTILIIDQTKRKAGITPFSGSFHTKFSSSLLTADWIIERRCPSTLFSSCDLAVSLPGFGNATFTNSTAVIGEKFGSINDFKHVNLSMTSNGQLSGALLAYPSDLSNSGSSFTVTSGYQTSNPTTQQNPTNQIPINATAFNELNTLMQQSLDKCASSTISNSAGCVNVINIIKQNCNGTLEMTYSSYFPVCNDPRLQQATNPSQSNQSTENPANNNGIGELNTDKASYLRSNDVTKVEITGKIYNFQSPAIVDLVISYPNSNSKDHTQVSVNSDGTFSYEYMLGPSSPIGTYNIQASYNNNLFKTKSFDLQ